MQWIEQKYIRILGLNLLRFKEIRTDTWNFRCPICGDSTSSEMKARGYIFSDGGTGYIFKCHRCGDARPFASLLKIVSPSTYGDYKKERFGETGKRRVRNRKKRDVTKQQKVSDSVLNGLHTINSLCDAHPAKSYLENRLIPNRFFDDIYYVDDMSVFSTRLPEYEDTKFDDSPRVIFPFRDKDGNLTHIQGRAIVPVDKARRFYTLDVAGGNKIFGLNRADFSKPVYVVESPIDSLFVRNGIAAAGSDASSEHLTTENTVYVWDNEPRSHQNVKRAYAAIDAGFSIVVWTRGLREKDVNEMIMSGMTKSELNKLLRERTFRGHRAKLELAGWSRI